MNFGHHPDPAVDFVTEVEAIENEIADRNAGLPPRFVIGDRIAKAMQFNVGGSAAAVVAKSDLRRIEAAFKASRADDTRDDDLIESAQRKIQSGEKLTKNEANAYMAQSLFNPTNQVYFRAGLIACREYMARFVEAQSPEIAASIRANWWPTKLGADLGPPRLMDWNELAEGKPDDDTFRVKTDEIGPTLEALPVALQFLQTAHEAPTNEPFRMPLIADSSADGDGVPASRGETFCGQTPMVGKDEHA